VADRTPPADLVLVHGRVYTVDDAKPWAEAVAVTGGKIVAVGSDTEVARHRGPRTRVVDLGGRMLMPAFGDAHDHPVFGGMSYARCSLHDGHTVDDYRRIIKACIARSPGSGTIYGTGWEDGLFPPDGIPHKEVLDALSSDRPLIFVNTGGHGSWVNSKALALAGISRSTPDPLNGKIDRDANGEPIGGLEESAQLLVEKLVPPVTPQDREDAIRYNVKLFNSLGITAWHDAMLEWQRGGTSLDLEAYKVVRDAGGLTMHTVMDIKWDNGRGLEQLPEIRKVSAAAKASGLTADGVKFFVDGVIPQQTAAMIAPYEGSADKGEAQIPLARLADAVTRIEAVGMQPHFHAIGDAAVREALDAVAAARKADGRNDTRPMISHLNVIDPADQSRFGQLGVTAIFQPLWAVNEPYMDLTKAKIGPIRSRSIYPEAGVLKGGGKIAYGSDWSVASANPLEGIETTITRMAPDGTREPLLPEQAVSLATALKAYTLNVAYVNHMDQTTGSIVPGKSADLIVLDQDLFRIKPREIHRTKVLVTLFEGREVFGSLATLPPR
jgi:predicted amidohydrolase YtcJ